MTQQPAQLRRRYTDQSTSEVFDVAYRDSRIVVSDGLREIAVVPMQRMAEGGYRLDNVGVTVPSFTRNLFKTPEAAVIGAVEYLRAQRGSDIGSEACMEQFVRELAERPGHG